MTLPRPRLRFAVAASALGVMAVASDARAFCREVTATAPAGYDPVSQGCFGADTPGIYEVYWKNLCVGYSLQKDASSQVTLDQATQIAAQAFAAWSGAPCGGGAASITAVDEGPVDCGVVQYNDNEANQHVIVFRDAAWPYDDSSNTLGLTTVTFDVTDGEIFDADMEINSHDYTLSVDGADAGAGSYDLLSIMTHEAGHFLGLAHSTDQTAMMFAHYESGATTLTADDVIGICTIDPADGTRSTSSGALPGDVCDPTPRHGFSTECNAPSSDDGGIDGETTGSAPGAAKSACSVGRPGHPGGMHAGMVGLLGLGLLAYRRRRRAGREGTAAATARK